MHTYTYFKLVPLPKFEKKKRIKVTFKRKLRNVKASCNTQGNRLNTIKQQAYLKVWVMKVPRTNKVQHTEKKKKKLR